MTPGRIRALKALGYGVVLLLLVAFVRQVPWRAVLLAARAADPWLLFAAAALNLVSLAAKGVRWWVFLRSVGVRSLPLVMRATFAGASLNNLVVAQGGEGARVLLVARGAGVSSARVLAALAVERGFDALSYLVLVVGAAWLLPLPSVLLRWRDVAGVVLGVAVLAVAYMLVRFRNAPHPVPDVNCAGGDTPSPLVRYTGHFRSAISSVTSAGSFAAGAALSVVAWLLQVATYHLVARATSSALPVAGSVAALLAVGVSFLVRATPGNVGVFQMVYAFTVASFGIARPDAVAIAILIQAVQVLPTLVAGGIAHAMPVAVRERQ